VPRSLCLPLLEIPFLQLNTECQYCHYIMRASIMKRFMSVCLIAVFSLILSACGHRHGREFLGKWVNVDHPGDTLLISKDGDNFILADPQHEVVAKYCDGTLSPNNGKGWCAYLKDTDTMNCAGASYKRISR
jgi:hypothetical protein